MAVIGRGVCVALWLCIVPSLAWAQSVSGTQRFSLSTALFEHANVETTVADADSISTQRLSVGPRSTLGLGYGVGLSKQLIVGADFWVGYESADYAYPRTSGLFTINRVSPLDGLGVGESPFLRTARLSALLAPQVEFVGEANWFVPFLAVGGLIGIHRDTLVSEWPSAVLDHAHIVPVAEHANVVQLGARVDAGAHFFLSEAISLDTCVRAAYAHSIWWDAIDQTSNSLGISVVFGISGWIWGSR